MNNLSEVKHHFSAKFMRAADDKTWVGPLETNFDFYVRPVSKTFSTVTLYI